MILVPKKRFISALFLPLIFFAVGLAWKPFINLGIISNVIIIFIGLIDIIKLCSYKAPEIKTDSERVFSINTENNFPFQIRNFSPNVYNIKISFPTPHTWIKTSEEDEHVIKGGSQKTVYHTFRPLRRGSLELPAFHFRYSRPKSMFWIQKKCIQKMKIDVIPDISEINKLIHFSRTNRLYEMGMHKNYYQGMGSEFESLREYQRGESAANIDWKVSTRVGRPVTRVYQMESNNNITFLIDCGRCMTAEQGGINSLDHAINSMLILAHIAVQMGDSINIIFFSDKILAEVYNLKGKSAIQKIKQIYAEINAQMIQSDFGKIFSYVSLKLKRRSYIMVFSDMVDDVQCSIFLKYMQFFQKKHLPLLVLLQDKQLSKVLDTPSKSRSELYRGAVAADMYIQRQHSVEILKKHKIMVIDVLPSQLSPPLINKYYAVKAVNMI